MLKKILFMACLISVFVLLPALSQAQTKQMFVPGYAFIPMNTDVDQKAAGGKIWVTNTTLSGWLMAPVYLPDNAGVTKIAVRYLDNGTSTFSVGLWRHNMYTNTEQQMASISSLGQSSSYQTGIDSSVTYWRISTSGYGYYLCINFGAAKGEMYKVEGVKIEYIE